MSDLIKRSVSLFLLLLSGPLVLEAQESVSEQNDKQEVKAVVQDSVDEMMSFLKNEELTPKERRDGVKGVLDSMADLELLAKLALGKTHWSRIGDEQRGPYVKLFVETIRQSIFEKLELFTDEKVEIGEPEAIRTSRSVKYRVVTWIISKGERIELALMLAKRDDGWKVYDLEIEGVSIRKSYGSQYADFLREKDFDELLGEMRERVAESQKKIEESDAGEAGRAQESTR